MSTGYPTVPTAQPSRGRRHHWDLAIMAARSAGRPHLIPVLDALSGIAVKHPDTASVWPYQATLAERLHRSTRTIQRWLVELEALGIIHKRRRWMNRGDGRFTGRASRYWPAPIKRLIAIHRAGKPSVHRCDIGGVSLNEVGKTGPGALPPPVPVGTGPPGRTDGDGCWHPAICACSDCREYHGQR